MIPTVRDSELKPAPDYVLAKLIARLLLNTIMPNQGVFSEAIAAEYVDAVRGYPERAVDKACEDYRHGRRGDGKFAPMPGELAIAVRAIHKEMVAERATADAEARERAQLRYRKTTRTPEEIERVTRLAEAVKAAIDASRMEPKA